MKEKIGIGYTFKKAKLFTFMFKNCIFFFYCYTTIFLPEPGAGAWSRPHGSEPVKI